MSYADITRINDYKRNFIADIHVGTLTLANGDKGKVASPCADYGNVQKERTLDLDVKCSITMEDGSELYIYYGVLCGIGMAAHDVSILSTIARWFVKFRGMASGIVKAGAGVGQMAVPLIAAPLILIWAGGTHVW